MLFTEAFWKCWGETYTIMPCAVNMSITCFDRMKSGITTPVVAAKCPCSKTDGGDLDWTLGRLHLHCLWERHVENLIPLKADRPRKVNWGEVDQILNCQK